MIDSDDVLLLRPVEGARGLDLRFNERPPVGATAVPPTVYGVAIWSGEGAVLPQFETEPSENTFPALPVRTDVNVRVAFSRFNSLAKCPDDTFQLRLSPTARSLLR